MDKLLETTHQYTRARTHTRDQLVFVSYSFRIYRNFNGSPFRILKDSFLSPYVEYFLPILGK